MVYISLVPRPRPAFRRLQLSRPQTPPSHEGGARGRGTRLRLQLVSCPGPDPAGWGLGTGVRCIDGIVNAESIR